MNAQEAERRTFATDAVCDLFKRHEREWIPWRDFAKIAPCSWRTRISEARRRLKAVGGTVEWNNSTKDSQYRYLPFQRQGRDASAYVTQPSLW